jgi:hypothetical protein
MERGQLMHGYTYYYYDLLSALYPQNIYTLHGLEECC